MTKKKDPRLTRSEALSRSWRSRPDFMDYDRTKGSMFNSWRALVYSKKGQLKGYPERWKKFDDFKEDVGATWQRGFVFCRKDTSLPYSIENFEWRPKGGESLCREKTLEYNGVTKTLIEWSKELGVNYGGVRQRYFKGKNYSVEQILFGKEKRLRGIATDIHELTDEQRKKDKVSKMLSQYRIKDKRKGLENDIDRAWFEDAIINGKCFYCGDTNRLGLDRIDNKRGHTMDNVVVCCYECNCARNENFSYAEMLVIGKAIREVKDRRKLYETSNKKGD